MISDTRSKPTAEGALHNTSCEHAGRARLKAPPSWSMNDDSGVIARYALVLLLSVMVAVVVRDDF